MSRRITSAIRLPAAPNCFASKSQRLCLNWPSEVARRGADDRTDLQGTMWSPVCLSCNEHELGPRETFVYETQIAYRRRVRGARKACSMAKCEVCENEYD